MTTGSLGYYLLPTLLGLCISVSWATPQEVAKKTHPSTQEYCHSVSSFNKQTQQYQHEKQCAPTKSALLAQELTASADKLMNTITPDTTSLLSKRYNRLENMMLYTHGLSFYEPTYLIPYYYSLSPSPWYAEHPYSTPNNVGIKKAEAKIQFSLLYPIWIHIFHSPISLNTSYTQLMYWQVYTKSAYFRATDYEPSLFFSYHPSHNWLLTLGFRHQSNGRGGLPPNGMERSWNRIYINIGLSGKHWLILMNPWYPFAYKTYNPNIVKYLGYGKTTLIFSYKDQTVSLMIRNMITSGFHRGALEFDYSFPLNSRVDGFIQLFHGYGQSLIEYDHRTTAFGFGISLSHWV